MASHVSQSASVYRFPGGVFVHSQSCTRDGIWVASLPAVLLSPQVDAAALGAAAADALAASGSIEVVDYSQTSAQVLKTAGVRSWSKLKRNARLCLLSRTASSSVVQPTRNGGTVGDDRGFHELPREKIEIAVRCANEDMGQAILSGLLRCQ